MSCLKSEGKEQNKRQSYLIWGFPGGSHSKESTCKVGNLGSIPRSGRSPGEGTDYPFVPGELHGASFVMLEHADGEKKNVPVGPLQFFCGWWFEAPLSRVWVICNLFECDMGSWTAEQNCLRHSYLSTHRDGNPVLLTFVRELQWVQSWMVCPPKT